MPNSIVLSISPSRLIGSALTNAHRIAKVSKIFSFYWKVWPLGISLNILWIQPSNCMYFWCCFSNILRMLEWLVFQELSLSYGWKQCKIILLLLKSTIILKRHYHIQNFLLSEFPGKFVTLLNQWNSFLVSTAIPRHAVFNSL